MVAPKPTSSEDWHREDIKAAIRKRGATMTSLSVENGYHKSVVHLALQRPWPKVEAIIAKFLEVPPQVIWPSRYHEDGTSKYLRQGKDRSRNPRLRKVPRRAGR